MTEKLEKFPDGSTDCHVHIYGPFNRFPAEHAGRFSPKQEFPVEMLFEVWESIGISRGVIVHAGNAGSDNEVTLEALKRFPDRLRAVAILNQDVTDRRLDELTEAGFKGVRINLLYQDGKPVMSGGGMNLDDLKALAPRIAERGWHAQLWIETGDLQQLAPEIEKLPLDFVIDHQGRTMADKTVNYSGYQWFCDRGLKSGRYWCKLSGADRNTRIGSPYKDTEDFMRALVAANPDRLVWGSDWPHVGHTDDAIPKEAVLMNLFERCVPDEAVRRKILIDNAARLYGF